MLLDTPGKAKVILDTAAAYGLRRLVETGTGYGSLADAVAADFKAVHTIEAYRPHFEAAKSRLARHRNVEVIFGDSADLLEPLLARAERPCLLWLDAHEDIVGGTSALTAELAVIAEDPRHVVLVDDARLCNGHKGWPTPGEIALWAEANRYTMHGPTTDIIMLIP